VEEGNAETLAQAQELHEAQEGARLDRVLVSIWCDGDMNGQRMRKSLETRDWARGHAQAPVGA
jgi:hypothetical protein